MPMTKDFALARGWPMCGGLTASQAAAFAPSIKRTADGSVGQVYTLVSSRGGTLQWLRDGVEILGAVGPRYVAQLADVGKVLAVREETAGRSYVMKAAGPVLDAPVLLEGFNSTAGWTASAGAILSSDAVNKVQGEAALQIAGNGTLSPKATKASIGAWTPAALGVVAWYFKLDADANKQCATAVRCCFVDAGGTEHVVSGASVTPALYQTPAAQYVGDYWHAYPITDIPALASQGAQTLGLAVTPTSNQPSSHTVRVDALMAKAGGRPTVILDFDDCHLSQYQNAPFLRDLGLVANINVVKNFIDQPNRMTRAMLDELYHAYGWDFGSQTPDDLPLTGKGSVAAAVAAQNEGRQFLFDNGWSRAADMGCYPNGAAATNGARVLVNSVTSNGTKAVTLGTAAATVAVGYEVEGYNVPAGTVVEAITDSTHFTLSNAVPAQVKAMSFTAPAPFAIGKLQQALVASGFKQMRTTLNRGHMHTRFGWAMHWMLFFGNATSGLTEATMEAMVDKAIAGGGTVQFYTHHLGDGSGNTPVETWKAQMRMLARKRDAGLVDVLTKSQWLARDYGSTVPL